MTQRSKKNLTVMFTDISGFTRHTGTISRDELMDRLDTHNDLLMPVIAHFDGTIVKTIGDAFLITFESPTNAVQCGLYMQHVLARFNADKPENKQIHIKVSINCGEVIVTKADVFGDPVNVCAKIEKATKPDEIYFTEAVFLAMHKAEVPNTFVKTFRPKGADSAEIKLYKVIQDEDDETYRRIIEETKIDPEAVEDRAAELSNVAEKEVSRYADVLETLVERQEKQSKQVLLAGLLGGLVLGAVLVFGAFFLLPEGESAADRLGRDVRAYLVNERPKAARNRITSYIERHGADETVETLLAEIEAWEIHDLSARASTLLTRGEAEAARSLIEAHFGDRPPTGDAQEVYQAGKHFLDARRLLREGAAEKALAELDDFEETTGETAIGRLRTRARTLIDVRTTLAKGENPERRDLIERLAGAFGDDTQNPAVLSLLRQLLGDELFQLAWNRGQKKALEELDRFRERFVHLGNWTPVELEIELGAIWEVGTRNRGRDWKKQPWWERVRRVKRAAETHGDARFHYRLGLVLYQLDRRYYHGATTGVREWQKALALDPSLKDRHRDLAASLGSELVQSHDDPAQNQRLNRQSLYLDLLQILDATDSGIRIVRDLLATHYYERARPDLVQGLTATKKDGSPDIYRRAGCFALLAEQGDAAAVEAPAELFALLLDRFIQSPDTLGPRHWKALFQTDLSYDAFRQLADFIEGHLERTRRKEGKYGSYTRAFDLLRQMAIDLHKAHPDHAERWEKEK